MRSVTGAKPLQVHLAEGLPTDSGALQRGPLGTQPSFPSCSLGFGGGAIKGTEGSLDELLAPKAVPQTLRYADFCTPLIPSVL